MARLQVRVECYSGYKADERPVRFYLGDTEYPVEEVLDQWYGPEATYFRVRAGDQNVYVLRHALSAMEEAWTLEAFRRV
jgi:hypothetical protein